MTSDLSPLTFRLSPLASSLRSATKNTRNTKIDQGRAEGKDESGKVENRETRNWSLIQIGSVESVVKIGSDHTKTSAEKMK